MGVMEMAMIPPLLLVVGYLCEEYTHINGRGEAADIKQTIQEGQSRT